MAQDVWQRRIVEHRGIVTKVRGVAVGRDQDPHVGDMSLGDAIIFVARPPDGFDTSSAVLLFGNNETLNCSQCQRLFDAYGRALAVRN